MPSGTLTTDLTGITQHYVQVGGASNTLTQVQNGTNGQVFLGETGNDPAFATLTSTNGTIDFTLGAHALNLDTNAKIAVQYDTDSGSAVPALGILDIVGSGSITTTGATNVVTVELTGLTNHAVLVGAGTTTITKVGPSASTGQVLQNNAAADPSYSTAIYPSTTTINEILYSSAADVVGGITAGAYGVLISDGFNVPSWLANSAVTNYVLTATVGATPSWKAITAAGAITTITGDSGGAESPTAGGNFNILGTGSITTVGTANTETIQLTGLTNHAVLVGAGTATITKVGPSASTGQVLQNNAGADPSYSTATYPSTTTANQLLYSSATNTVAGLTSANSGVLTTSTSGVPSIDTTNFQVLTTGVQMKGNNTNTAPPAGFIGEQLNSYVAQGAGPTLTTVTAANVTSLSLTPGIWDVTGLVFFSPAATTTVASYLASISATSATATFNYGSDATYWGPQTGTVAAYYASLIVPQFRITLGSTTTYYLVAYSSFATSTMAASGRLTATRVG